MSTTIETLRIVVSVEKDDDGTRTFAATIDGIPKVFATERDAAITIAPIKAGQIIALALNKPD